MKPDPEAFMNRGQTRERMYADYLSTYEGDGSDRDVVAFLAEMSAEQASRLSGLVLMLRHQGNKVGRVDHIDLYRLLALYLEGIRKHATNAHAGGPDLISILESMAPYRRTIESPIQNPAHYELAVHLLYLATLVLEWKTCSLFGRTFMLPVHLMDELGQVFESLPFRLFDSHQQRNVLSPRSVYSNFLPNSEPGQDIPFLGDNSNAELEYHVEAMAKISCAFDQGKLRQFTS